MLQELLKKYRKDRDRKSFIDLQNYLDPDNTKCRICKDSIYYDNSKIMYNEKLKKLSYTGTTYNTKKKVNDNMYNLTVCQHCVENTFLEYKTLNKSRVYNVMCKITKFAFEIDDSDYKISRSAYAMTLENMIKKYGEELGNKKWKNYCEQQSYTNKFEYKNKRYGWNEDDYKKYNMSRSITLDNCIKRHGIEKGERIYKNYVEKQKVAGITYEYFINTYGKEIGEIKYYNMLNKKMEGSSNSKHSCVSKSSQIFFNKLEKEFNTYNIYDIYYHNRNKEYRVRLNTLNKIICLDFYIPDMKLCIEYNGDLFHANPKIFTPEEAPLFRLFNKTLMAKDIWEKDKNRYTKLKEEYDINTIVVWESDVNKLNIKEFVNNIIKECKNGILL